MARGDALAFELLPVLERPLTPDLDAHAYERLTAMKDRYADVLTRLRARATLAARPGSRSLPCRRGGWGRYGRSSSSRRAIRRRRRRCPTWRRPWTGTWRIPWWRWSSMWYGTRGGSR